MNIKPFQDIDPHNVVDGFALNTPTGAKGTPVVIASTGGWNNSQALSMQTVPLPGNPTNNRYWAPRFAVVATIRAAVSGERPFGIQMWDVKEATQFGEATIYHPQWCAENQCTVSGAAVPVVRKGLFLVGPFPTGDTTPTAGRYAAVKNTGEWGVITSQTGQFIGAGITGFVRNPFFGEFLGGPDRDGYVLTDVNCYL